VKVSNFNKQFSKFSLLSPPLKGYWAFVSEQFAKVSPVSMRSAGDLADFLCQTQ
jgi:hypothetical protein